MRVAEEKEYIEAFEYGSGDFPTWFNTMVGNAVCLYDDTIFIPKGKRLGDIAGFYRDDYNTYDFNYGDIITKGLNGRIAIYDKVEFINKFKILESI